MSILHDYNNTFYKRNQEVTLKKEGAVFRAIIKEVNKDGLLQVENAFQTQFTFGEVEWVIPK